MYRRDQDVHGCGRGRRRGYDRALRHGCVHRRHVSGRARRASDCVSLQVRAYVRGVVLLRRKDC